MRADQDIDNFRPRKLSRPRSTTSWPRSSGAHLRSRRVSGFDRYQTWFTTLNTGECNAEDGKRLGVWGNDGRLRERPRMHPERVGASDTSPMEIRCGAFSKDAEIKLIVEPWGHEFEIPEGSPLHLVLEGAPTTEMTVNWLADGVMVWPPRGTILRVLSDDDEELQRFDTIDIPPVPPRWDARA